MRDGLRVWGDLGGEDGKQIRKVVGEGARRRQPPCRVWWKSAHRDTRLPSS